MPWMLVWSASGATFDLEWALPARYPGGPESGCSQPLAPRVGRNARRATSTDERFACEILEGTLQAKFSADASTWPVEFPFTVGCRLGGDKVSVRVVERNPALDNLSGVVDGVARIVRAPTWSVGRSFSLPDGVWEPQDVDATLDDVRCRLHPGPPANVFVIAGAGSEGRGACVFDGPEGPHEFVFEVAVAPLTMETATGGTYGGDR